MANDKASTHLDMIPRLFYRRLGIILTIFFLLTVVAWQAFVYYQSRVFLEFHYSAVMLKLMQLKEDILVNSLIASLIFFAVPCLLTAAFLVYYSHRIAGPMYRIKRYLKEDLRDPQARELSFRSTDVLHSLAQAVNEVQSRYRNDCQQVDKALGRLEQDLEAALTLHAAGESVDGALSQVRASCQQIEENLRMIKT